jgi:hypothetical protein
MARCETGKAPTYGRGFLAFVGALGSVRSLVIRLITSNAMAIRRRDEVSFAEAERIVI